MSETSSRSQFARPRGVLGRLAGRVMAVTNADMNRLVVDMLHLQGDERVLEIGFGPGVGIALLAGRLPRGQVFGVDPSEVMLKQATRRNLEAIREGRVELRIGRAARLPWEDGYFDAVCSVNTVQFWRPLEETMREVRRVITPRGRLAIGVHGWAGKGTDHASEGSIADEVEGALRRAGFAAVTVRRHRARGGRAFYFSARA